MTELSAPYRFVPLSKFVLRPEWAKQVSQDMPFADGVCGELHLNLTCYSPLCLGGDSEKSDEKIPGKLRFFRDPSGQPAVPGTSIKGMLRNVLEIASFARFRQVEDQRLGVRDLTKADNFYMKAIRKPETGWLSFKGGQWSIQPCDSTRLHQGELIKICNIPKEDWLKCKSVKQRYEQMGICPKITFNRENIKRGPGDIWQATPSEAGAFHGRIVVTGQPGSDYTTPKGKKYEFIFHDEQNEVLPVLSTAMMGFMQIHEESEEWSYWQGKMKENRLPMGVPVFFHRNERKEVKSLGLAMMYKLAYKHSIHDIIGHTDEMHLDDVEVSAFDPDLPDLIFGFSSETRGLRGRVNIGMASVASSYQLRETKPTVLNSPKPTFYPAYIHQDAKIFMQMMEDSATLSGWKRYPAKKSKVLPPPDKSQPSVQVILETIDEGAEFMLPIRFHNLRPVELGALLWSIDFGGKKNLRHALGAGKPYGLGQVGLTIKADKTRLRSNDSQKHIDSVSDYLEACREEFRLFMEQVFENAGLQGGWENSTTITALRRMANPGAYHSEALKYMKLEDFKDVKEYRKNVDHFHIDQPVVPVSAAAKELSTYHNEMDRSIELAKKQQLLQRVKEQRETLKREASTEDKLLIELEDRILQSESQVTSTLKDNINTSLRNAFKFWENMSKEQQKRLSSLAKRTAHLEDKKIGKIVKKILDATGSD